MLRALCLLVLLALAGCSSGTGSTGGSSGSGGGDGSGHGSSVASRPPRLGACRLLTAADVDHPSNDTTVVPCSARHTAQTFAVGSFPAALAKGGPDAAALGAYVYRRCQPSFRSFLGANDSLLLRSTLAWGWFRSSTQAWDAGAHTWRCDVTGDDGRKLQALPRTAKGLLLGKPADRWMVCVDGPTVTGSSKIPCTARHTWRAVTTVVLGTPKDAYPGDRLSQVRTRDFCSDSVGAWMNYPVDYDYGYTWFHRAEWKAGNRRAVCWAKTAQ